MLFLVKTIAIIFFSLLTTTIIAQRTLFFGGKVGVTLNLGTHVNSVGLIIGAYLFDKHVQVNTTFQGNYNFSNFGNRQHYFSSKISIGAIGTWGDGRKFSTHEIHPLNYQSHSKYGFGYEYCWYLDKVGSSQNSGGIALHLDQFSLYMENDFLAGNGRDRFHTGSLYFSYNDSLFSVGTGFDLWTGETRSGEWIKKTNDRMPNGYKNISNQPYGRTSHGIWFTRLNIHLPYRQNMAVKIGWDTENIRHIIQNRLMHDLIFIPKKIPRKTPHVPRLNDNGLPCFSSDSVREPRLYLQMGLNSSWEN